MIRPPILDEALLGPSAARYWRFLQRTRTDVDLIDPWRHPLKLLRANYPKGTIVYRASTGGRWGKSAHIAVL
jgi:hypothetical protein